MSSIRHKQPINQKLSKFITESFEKHPSPVNFPILDLACGYGRHSIHFSNLGYKVFSADMHKNVFDNGWANSIKNLAPIILDGTKSMPFSDGVFGGIIVVHFYSPGLFSTLKNLVAPRGMIYYESIGGHGGNWPELGKANQVKDELIDEFEMEVYKERLIGPSKQYATVRMCAMRKM